MAYISMGPDSDVYLMGVPVDPGRSGEHAIRCLGCKLNTQTRPMTENEKNQYAILELGDDFTVKAHPDPEFYTHAGVCKHLDAHRQAGHHVPETIYDEVLENDWLG